MKGGKGAYGEYEAARYLRKKGYNIVGANFRCRFGEIDIIGEKDGFLVFVEVKTRDENSFYTPAEAVTYKKIQRLVKTAQIYLMQNDTSLQPRFDVIEVYTSGGKVKRINHIENAFEGVNGF